MFLIGILGILQILLFPGLLARKYIQFSDSFFIHLAEVVAISLIGSYCAALALAAAGLFTRTAFLLIFVIETIWMAILYWQPLLLENLESSLAGIWNRARDAVDSLFGRVEKEDPNRFAKVLQFLFMLVALIAALVAVEWISRFFRDNLGSVFNNWDDVISWNRWAVEWASNRFPTATEDYPQLIPLNWEVIYLFLGTSKIKLFAKAIMPLFSLLTVLILFGMGVHYRNAGYFVAVALLRLMLKKFSGEFIASGYVDLPLAFMAVLAISILFECSQAQTRENRRRLYFLAVVIASGAAVVKQPGLVLLAAVLLIGFFYAFGLDSLRRLNQTWRELLPIGLAPLVITFPWYIYKIIQFAAGIERSHLFTPLEHSNQVHASSSLFANILPGLLSLDKYFYVILFSVAALLVVGKFWRQIGIILIFPYVLLWAGYASYDVRNLTLMFPLISILAGLGVSSFYDLGVRLLDRLRLGRFKLVGVLVALLVGVGALSLIFTPERLQERQIEQQKLIFSPNLNGQLYSYFETHPKARILTSYPVDFLPGLEGLQVNFYYQNYQEFINLMDNTDIGFLLVPANADDKIIGYIASEVEASRMEALFENDDYIRYQFVRIVKRP